MSDTNGNNSKSESLTPRQLEILALYGSGYTGPEISKKIFLSLHTVKNYTKAAKRRTGAKTIAHMVVMCIKDDLLVVEEDGKVKINEY